LVILIVVTSTELIIFSKQQLAEAHILSSNENASLLEMFYQMRIEALLVQSNFLYNKTLAYEHAKNAAAELLDKNWTNVVADRNIVANFFSTTLNDLVKSTESITTNNNSYEEIKGEVNALNNMLFEFVLLYLNNNNNNNSISYNPSLQALIIAEIANEINDKYEKAFGIIVNSSNMNMSMLMATTTMYDKKQPSMMNTTNMTITGNNTDNHMSTPTELLKSVVDYQTAQALTIQAQDILNKNLKPIAPMNATNANLELEKALNQLKNAIDSKAPVMDIMKIIHIQIHPILISTYKLQLKR
jgi:hypothetical protein